MVGKAFEVKLTSKGEKKKARIERELKKRQPLVNENVKVGMFIRGHKTSQQVNDVLSDFASLKKPFSIKYNKKKSNGQIGPFEDETGIEFFSTKADASLFMYGSHSKKRPNNIVIGRLFNYHILDMFEFGVTKYKPLDSFPTLKQNVFGSKPCFAVIGAEFQNDHRFKIAANMIVDFFRGRIVSSINLAGLDHVIVLSVGPGKDQILFRRFGIQMKRSGTKVPKVELVEVGPAVDFEMRRQHLAAPELEKEALRTPFEQITKKQKNISMTPMHDKVGTVHVHAQNVDKMTATIVPAKALRNKGGKRKREDRSEGGSPQKKLREQEA